MNKKLTLAKMRYFNIETEMLAVAIGYLKYHHYLYGRRFVCKLDHQPLEKKIIRCTIQTTKVIT